MSLLRPAYGSILVTVIILALTLVAGNVLGGVQAAPAAAPARAPEALPQEAAPQVAVQEQAQSAIGEVSGAALPGDAVRVTQGEALIGETVAGADGTWRVPIPKSVSAITPYHVQILPSAKRGATEPPEEPVTVLISVVIGLSKVEVRVQVTSPNGQIDVEVLTPINPPCEAQAQATPQPADQPVYHQVRAGETLAGIAGRYGVTTQALMQANRLRNANLIFVGQQLAIPATKK